MKKEQGDILVLSEKDKTVSINMSRDDLLDLYSALRGLDFNSQTFASEEVRSLIKRFFTENQDVKTEPNSSYRFFSRREKDYDCAYSQC